VPDGFNRKKLVEQLAFLAGMLSYARESKNRAEGIGMAIESTFY
jgi:hypothetical protein